MLDLQALLGLRTPESIQKNLEVVAVPLVAALVAFSHHKYSLSQLSMARRVDYIPHALIEDFRRSTKTIPLQRLDFRLSVASE